jgi:hypothetical protein
VKQVNDMQENYLVSMQNTLAGLVSDISGDAGLAMRTSTLEAGIVNITGNIVKVLA